MPNRSLITQDIHGNPLFAESQYIANAAQIGSVGRNIAASGFTVGGSYVVLDAGLTYRTVLSIYNNGSEVLFIGPSGNGTSHMYPVATGGQIALNITSGVTVYAITAGSDTDVRIIEIG